MTEMELNKRQRAAIAKSYRARPAMTPKPKARRRATPAKHQGQLDFDQPSPAITDRRWEAIIWVVSAAMSGDPDAVALAKSFTSTDAAPVADIEALRAKRNIGNNCS